jgi:predicted MFS family arabinose efflux permease
MTKQWNATHSLSNIEGRFSLMLIMAFTSLSTLLDLFGPHSIVPLLAREFAVSAPAMGLAVNAAAAGMAVCGLVLYRLPLPVRPEKLMSGALAALAIPTLLLAHAPSIEVFALLRVVQGVFMCAAFAVAIAYISANWGACGSAPLLMASYVTGNVGSNLFGRLLIGTVADHSGWQQAFIILAILNLSCGLALWLLLPRSQCLAAPSGEASRAGFGLSHLANAKLGGACAVGFMILFAFIGVFTYVNFKLAAAPFYMTPGQLGLLYLIFSASLITTPLAGHAVRAAGHSRAAAASALVSLCGILLTLSPGQAAVMAGLALLGSGLFFTQAIATSFVGHTAKSGKVAASGLYLFAYYCGGIAGAVVVGHVYQNGGWEASVAVISAALVCLALVASTSWR